MAMAASPMPSPRMWLCALLSLLAGAVGLVGCGAEVPPTAGPVGGAVRLGGVLGQQGAAGYDRAEHPRVFAYPGDLSPHPQYRTEWWYLTAVLRDAQGGDYGVQYTLFRQALQPPGERAQAGRDQGAAAQADINWQPQHAYMGHLAVTDVVGQRHQHAQRLVRGHPQLATVQRSPLFNARIEDWSLQALDTDARRLQLTGALDASNEVRLSFTAVCDMVLQGDAGLSHKGPGAASYYFSLPRLRVTGELVQAGETIPVQGVAWFDREWSTSVLGDHLSGWSWFALQLDDGRSIMVFKLRRRDGATDPYDHGVVVSDCGAQQSQRTLRTDDYELQPVRMWRDAAGRNWPVEWSLHLGDERFTIAAMLDDQLMDTSVTYWEGIVSVQDGARRQVGRGYMELTGYTAGERDDE